jgi:hypothetical protein
VTQAGSDPHDMKMIGDEFVLGPLGKWLALGHFFKLPAAERREALVFGAAAAVMQRMSHLSSQVEMFGRAKQETAAPVAAADDERAAAFQAARQKGSAKSQTANPCSL